MAGNEGEQARAGSGRLWLIGAIVAISAVLAGFYGIDVYAAGTRAAVHETDVGADHFEVVFRDLLASRFRVMGLAADVMLQDSVAMEAFAKGERAALVARIEPFFVDLQKRHGIEKLNFWLPPAKLYYQAGQPNDFGADASKYRRAIVAANERQQRLMALETGLGGHVDIRAIVPVTDGSRYVGALEFASNLDVPLARASETSGL